jgi:hypothetical protein
LLGNIIRVYDKNVGGWGLDRKAKGVIASSGGGEAILPECIEAVAE